LAEKSKDDKDDKEAYPKPGSIPDICPHCGHELSPWQQVLLTIDRALVCKNCWYRIILDISEAEEGAFHSEEGAPYSGEKE
jgi:DNA-directed RNA polymerase subunit RPC12/RpoP